MYLRTFSAALFTLFFLVLTSPGQCVTQAEPVLALKQAVRIALKHNPSLAQQANSVEINKISVSQQQSNFYPDLDATLSGQDSAQNDFSLSTQLTSTLNLFNGFADSAALKNAELELDAVQESLTREQQSLVFETFSNFVQVLTSQALIQVKEKNLEENRKLLEQIETFHQAGRLPLSDLYQQQAETKQAQLELMEAQQSLSDNKLLLMQTMGMNPMSAYRVAEPDFDSWSVVLTDAEIASLRVMALDERADLKAQQYQIEAAGQQVLQAKAGQLPKLDLFAKLSSGYSSLDDETFSEQLRDDSLDATIGMSLTIPIFDRHLTRNEMAKAKIAQRNEQLTLKQKKLQVGLEIEQAIQEYRTTQQQVDVVQSKLISARQSLQSYEERYRVGASTLVELTQARTEYVTAVFDQIEVKYNLITQEVALAYYLGNMKPLFAAFELENS
ncbi:outer membrane protein [Desulfuromusa kysingii]|uniref:Outer membrane protein n=1 Tax=Desulfuromusa kysingii TaxID=37625 RepID=A0A1H4DYH3_9BACT|nr:TolC family protein [Desulfuromusa kysingii]SEA77539.1 outer membrane protein [Desulfuromusa kysingii]